MSGCQSDNENTSVTLVDQTQPMTQQQLESIAQTLKVDYQHLTNVAGEHCDTSLGDGACFQVKL